MPILELCAGYGGLGMAVEVLTGDKVAYVGESGTAASKVLAYRFPYAPNIGDISAYDWSQLDCLADVITAGFPCEDISNAGPRGGINGKRSRVWKCVAEATRVLRPRLLFLENVGAIRTRGLDIVASDLAGIGYDMRWTTLRASDIGAAHIRLRWFAVARPSLSNADSLGRDRGARDEPEPKGRDEPADGRHSPAGWWGDYLPAIRRWECLILRPAPEPVELGPRGGRRLTARFAEWLMGLPAGWVTDVPGISRSDQIQVIGKGAMPQQAYEAYRRLLED